jgi:DNA-binding CsgD family transcriptional regulator
MTPAKPFARELTALSDKELEVLRLLAAGHTVKSIAARLQRSEASINERLRDARRKTCVGSSRELARLLDAQKIWDKNIDLAIPRPTEETLMQPPGAGRKWSKGTIMMLVAIPIAAAGLIMAATNSIPSAAPKQPAHAAAISKSPLAGTWSLNVEGIPAEERPGRVSIRFREAPDGKWMIHVEMVGPDGTSRYADSIAATDGVQVPITGDMDFIDSVSLRQPGPNTLVMTLGKQGAPVSTRVYTVSKDRKSMTETIVWANQAIPQLETTYFIRVD